MKQITDRFHRHMEVEPEQTFKAFLFVVNGLAATGFLFVFGHVVATGTVTRTTMIIVGIAATLDLAPQLVTVRLLRTLPDPARRAEILQLGLKAVAYIVLLSAATGMAAAAPAYTAFILLWLVSFLVEESVMVLAADVE